MFLLSTFVIFSAMTLLGRYILKKRIEEENRRMRKFLESKGIETRHKPEPKSKCPRCETEVDPQDTFCSTCGLYLEGTEDLDAISDEQDLEE